MHTVAVNFNFTAMLEFVKIVGAAQGILSNIGTSPNMTFLTHIWQKMGRIQMK